MLIFLYVHVHNNLIKGYNQSNESNVHLANPETHKKKRKENYFKHC